jgi:hypothetical protein
MVRTMSSRQFAMYMRADALFRTEPARGQCYVICFSPNHAITLAEMQAVEIVRIVEAWCVLACSPACILTPTQAEALPRGIVRAVGALHSDVRASLFLHVHAESG